MLLRSAWTGLLLLVVMAVACLDPACGVACAAKVPCHDAAMAGCDGMISVAALVHPVAGCAQDEAVLDRSDFEVHPLVGVAVDHVGLRMDAAGRMVAVKAVRGGAKAPPRPVWVMRV